MKRKTVGESQPLLQEIYRDDPWRMLVCCIMLNQTSRTQVDRVRGAFFEAYPDPEAAAASDPGAMAVAIASLGLQNRRAEGIVRFSAEYAWAEWDDVSQLHLIGKYARDSWAVFQEGRLDVDADDKELVAYLRRERKRRRGGRRASRP